MNTISAAPSTAQEQSSLPRVLHVLEATLGGTLRYLKDILEAVPSDQFALGLVYSRLRADESFEQALDTAHSKGWETFDVPMVRAVSPVDDFRCAHQLRKVIKQFRPDIVHCHSSKAGALGRLACLGLSRRPKIVYNPHAIAASLGRQYLIAEKILRPLADRFGAVSKGERDELILHGLSRAEQADVIAPLIDTTYYRRRNRLEARLELGVQVNCHLLVGIGRLVDQKNPLLFVEIVRQLTLVDPAVRAIWLGEGIMQEHVAAEIRRCGLEGIVTLPGWKPDVRPYLAAAHILLSTAVYESFGYVAAEALAMEVPVVASAISGTTDILGDELAELLYPPGNTDAAVKVIVSLLNDETYARKMGQSGRSRVVKEFSVEKMSAALTRVYRTLLGTNTDAVIAKNEGGVH